MLVILNVLCFKSIIVFFVSIIFLDVNIRNYNDTGNGSL
jgi:hypothetical protein